MCIRDSGYLDGVPVKSVQKYEKELLANLHAEHGSLLSGIASEKKLTDELESTLKSALDTFTANFAA